MLSPLTDSDIVFVAHPLADGSQALMPRKVVPRSCIRLDGHRKNVYESRAEAREGCPKEQTAYRCNFCGHWHRATKRKRADVAAMQETFRVAWVRTRAA